MQTINISRTAIPNPNYVYELLHKNREYIIQISIQTLILHRIYFLQCFFIDFKGRPIKNITNSESSSAVEVQGEAKPFIACCLTKQTLNTIFFVSI